MTRTVAITTFMLVVATLIAGFMTARVRQIHTIWLGDLTRRFADGPNEGVVLPLAPGLGHMYVRLIGPIWLLARVMMALMLIVSG